MNLTAAKQWFLRALVAVLLLAGSGLVVAKVYPHYVQACAQPLQYSIGTIDDRFNESAADFQAAVAEAEQIWEGSTHRNLFEYSAQADLKINLVYDYRQETTDKLESLGYKIENTQSSYNNLKSRYDSLLSDYTSRKAALDQEISQFDAQKQAYEDQVAAWNAQGGAPASEAAALSAQYSALNAKADKINAEKDSINDSVNEINALVEILNSLASQLKLNVSSYNTVGSERGEEFEEGVYVRDASGTNINIFEFSSHDQLVRLLAHEMGHALGLEHVDDPNAIMYRLNQTQSNTLTAADLSELARVCKFTN